MLVFDDADIDTAAAGARASKFRDMGRTCVCANRIFVQDGIYDDFVAALAEAVSRLKVGDGFDDGVGEALECIKKRGINLPGQHAWI